MKDNNIQTGKNISPKKKRKFNIIDFIILVLILAIIATAVYAFLPFSQIKKLWATNEVAFSYTVELKGVDIDYIDNIKNGDSVINSNTNNSMGTVSGVADPTKSYTLGYKENNDDNEAIQAVIIESMDKYDVKIYISATAQYEKNIGYTVNGCRVAVGEELELRFPKYSGKAYCTAIVQSK